MIELDFFIYSIGYAACIMGGVSIVAALTLFAVERGYQLFFSVRELHTYYANRKEFMRWQHERKEKLVMALAEGVDDKPTIATTEEGEG